MTNNKNFTKSIDDAVLKIIETLKSNMESACIVLEAEVKRECPVDQGILRVSIVHEVILENESVVGCVGSSQEVAPHVHQGTGLYAKDGNGRKTPWTYEAKGGKYDGWHTTKGQKPNPFMDRAKNKAKTRIENKLGGK